MAPLKAVRDRRFSDDFKGNSIYLIGLNPLNIRSEIWTRPLTLSDYSREEHLRAIKSSLKVNLANL